LPQGSSTPVKASTWLGLSILILSGLFML
jgi:hypothetical protein